MSSPFLGEIRIFAGTFAPVGWLTLDGQTLPISQYDALYSLLGTVYGGDGVQTFNLPDLRSRAPMHTDSNTYQLGAAGGTESVTITMAQTPTHTHQWQVSGAVGDQNVGTLNLLSGSKDTAITRFYEGDPQDGVFLAPGSVTVSGGGSQPHENCQPFLCVNYIIATEGIYPSQS